jgi:arylsulfatase A-like enzyme
MGACTKEPDTVTRPRLILFISMDTARADHFGFMGNSAVRTPNLDAIAMESIVFTDYMTVVPTTLASHVSLFTGKYPHHHGTPRNGRPRR